MKTMEMLKGLFAETKSMLPFGKIASVPLLIIRKNADDAHDKEFNSIEEAIADLENDPNIPPEKIEKLRSSLKNLKNKTSIKIRNGEILNS